MTALEGALAPAEGIVQVPNFWSNLAHSLANLFKYEVKPFDSSFDAQIRAIADEVAKRRFTRESISVFARLVRDPNPIHQIPESAVEFGAFLGLEGDKAIKDTPATGAELAAYATEVFDQAVGQMRTHWNDSLRLISLEARFRGFVFPGDKMEFRINEEYTKSQKGIVLSASGKVKDEEVLRVHATIGNNYDSPPQLTANPAFRTRYSFVEQEVEQFCGHIGTKYKEGNIPRAYSMSFTPSALVDLLEKRTGTRFGLNASMDFNYTGDNMVPGDFYIDIDPIGRGGRARKLPNGNIVYDYRLLAICHQEGRVLNHGKIICASAKEIDFSSQSSDQLASETS